MENIKIRLTNPEKNLTCFLQENFLHLLDDRQLIHLAFRGLPKETRFEYTLFHSACLPITLNKVVRSSRIRFY